MPMLSRAEELYRAYHGSSFHMGRDNVLEEYRALNPDPEDERKWRRELITEAIQAAKRGETTPLSQLTTMEAVEALAELAPLASEHDAFFRLRVAETIWQLADTDAAERMSQGARRRALDAAFAAAEEIARGDFALPPDERVSWLIREGTDVREALVERALGEINAYRPVFERRRGCFLFLRGA